MATIVNLDGEWADELEANLDRYDRRYPGRFVTFARVDWTDTYGCQERAVGRAAVLMTITSFRPAQRVDRLGLGTAGTPSRFRATNLSGADRSRWCWVPGAWQLPDPDGVRDGRGEVHPRQRRG